MQDLHLPVLYSENCPNEPTIPAPLSKQDEELKLDDQISRATRVTTNSTLNASFFNPKIIKAKKVLNESYSYELTEHRREMRSMKERIENCKNLQQRKKDRNDPAIYPPYFVRNNYDAQDVRVDNYARRVLRKSKFMNKSSNSNSKHASNLNFCVPQKQDKFHRSKPSMKKYQYVLTMEKPANPEMQNIEAEVDDSKEESYLPSPSFNRHPHVQPQVKKRPQSGKRKPEVANLPNCEVGSILDHIYNKCIYKQSALQALRLRMAHEYGKEPMDKIWATTMQLLKRNI